MIGQPFTELDEVPSTNIYAVRLMQENLAAHGASFFAWNQTEGRGQRGRSWASVPGAGIALSVVLDAGFLPPSQQFPLVVVCALAAHDLFEKYAGGDTSIKWPNDLYWRDRKAGGILVENTIGAGTSGTAALKGAVAGFGININQESFPGYLPNPVSLRQATGISYDVVALAKELCACLQQRYEQLKAGGAAELLAAYNRSLYGLDRQVRLKKETASFNAVVKGVNERGELLVKDCLYEKFVFGEVEWIMPGFRK